MLIYLKQAWNLFRENLFMGTISILGTAISIGLIMTYLVGGYWAKMMDIAPETKRTRTLYIKWMGAEQKETGHIHGVGNLSLKTIQACFQSLQTPEAVMVTSPVQSRLASIPGGRQKKGYVLFTDDIFWQVMDFNFMDGAPYTLADFESGIKKVVLGERIAKTLFGSTEQVVGKQMQLNYVTYTVCGVVKDVSPWTSDAFGDIWMPYTATHIPGSYGPEDILGHYKCQLVARSHRDFPAILREVEKTVGQYDASLSDYRINMFRQPDTKLVNEDRFGYGYPDMEGSMRVFGISIIIILLVPAVNLSGFTLSRMKERMAEMGVRKAFGATRVSLFGQVLGENLFYSLAGGFLGYFASYLLLYVNRNFVFASGAHWGMDITPDMPVSVVFNPWMFVLAFLFCLLINLLSASIPAWRVSKMQVVDSLKG